MEKKQSIFTNLKNMNKELLEKIIKPGDTVIDATLGKGNDSLFLAKLVGSSGKVFGFDIQEKAIELSEEKMQKAGYHNYFFVNKSHEYMDAYVKNAKAVVFNLGYLPGSNKDIATKSESTLEGIKKSIKILEPSGIILIMFYLGHSGGIEERDLVLSFVKKLDKNNYDVLEIKQINGIETAPFLLTIYKKEE